MKYYAVQVKTTQEEKYIHSVTPKLVCRMQSERLLFLRRRLPVRKGGVTTMQLSPLFPGYVFLETEDLDAALHNTLRRTPGFFRFLRSTQQPTELSEKDLATLHHFMSFGEVVEPSAVHFDENDRIVVDSGPLKGLEGKIVKVDRRKNRAKIQLDMYTDNFLIDLAFRVITKGTEREQTDAESGDKPLSKDTALLPDEPQSYGTGDTHDAKSACDNAADTVHAVSANAVSAHDSNETADGHNALL